MKLTLGSGAELEDPSLEQVESALRELPGGPDSFAILGSDDEIYMQTSGGGGAGFTLEYREGSQAAHFHCTDTHLSAEQVVAAFRAYREGRSDYKSDLPWELEADAPRPGARLVMGALAVLGGLAFVFYRCGS